MDNRDTFIKVDKSFDAAFQVCPNNVRRLTLLDTMDLKVGDVVLVRSTGVPEMGDHYIVVTGPPIEKPQGRRIQQIAVPASDKLLRTYIPDEYGLILLQLLDTPAAIFLDFHDLVVKSGKLGYFTPIKTIT